LEITVAKVLLNGGDYGGWAYFIINAKNIKVESYFHKNSSNHIIAQTLF